MTASSRTAASINQMGDHIVSYFSLRKDNDLLNDEICRLQAQVQDLQNRLEPAVERDSLCYRYADLDYRMIPAKVIDVTTDKQHNYLTLNKGTRDGIYEGMGVICNRGVVGIVSRVNERFAMVVPLIHTTLNLSSRLQQSGYMGFTHWEGFDSRHVQLLEIGRHIPVTEGDTVVTSGMTATFPEGIAVGVVDKIQLDDGDNYYNIRLRLSTDYTNLRYVQVLENAVKAEMDSLIAE